MKACLPAWVVAEVSALAHSPALMNSATISVGSRSSAATYIATGMRRVCSLVCVGTTPAGEGELGRCHGVTEAGSKVASHPMISDAVAACRSGSVAGGVLRVRKVGMARVTLRSFWLGHASTHSRQPLQDVSVTRVRVFTGIAIGQAWLHRSQPRQAAASRWTAIGLSFPASG